MFDQFESLSETEIENLPADITTMIIDVALESDIAEFLDISEIIIGTGMDETASADSVEAMNNRLGVLGLYKENRLTSAASMKLPDQVEQEMSPEQGEMHPAALASLGWSNAAKLVQGLDAGLTQAAPDSIDRPQTDLTRAKSAVERARSRRDLLEAAMEEMRAP